VLLMGEDERLGQFGALLLLVCHLLHSPLSPEISTPWVVARGVACC
jgi:hypothetical protein